MQAEKIFRRIHEKEVGWIKKALAVIAIMHLYKVYKLFIFQGAFMFVDNTADWGRLTNPDNYDSTHLHNDMYAMFDNRIDWEEKYLHPEYYVSVNLDSPGQGYVVKWQSYVIKLNWHPVCASTPALVILWLSFYTNPLPIFFTNWLTEIHRWSLQDRLYHW